MHAKVNARLHGRCIECMTIAVDVKNKIICFAKLQSGQFLLNQPVSKGPASYALVS